jgi:chemotaxis protein MotB
MPRLKFSRRIEEEKVWQVSYIDLLTAMLAAFTMLLSISTPDQTKLDSLTASMVTDAKTITQNLVTLAQQLKETIESDPALRDQVRIVITDQGNEMRFRDKLLFPVGKAKLQKEGYSALQSISTMIRPFVEARDAYLAVEGHTDDQQMGTRGDFKSNWELATARALEVVHFLQDSCGFDTRRMSGTGFADVRPANKERDPETGKYTDLARSDNRRVVIRIYYYREPKEESNNNKQNK